MARRAATPRYKDTPWPFVLTASAASGGMIGSAFADSILGTIAGGLALILATMGLCTGSWRE